MLPKKLEKAINEAINQELYSKYLYLSVAAYFGEQNLDGFAHWFMLQQREEEDHALKFFSYLINRGGRVVLKTLEQPPHDFKTPLEVFQFALDHERSQTKSINKLMDLAIEENDHSARGFLQWFVDEQVEEEASFEKICSRVKLNGDSGAGLLVLDAKLGDRTAA